MTSTAVTVESIQIVPDTAAIAVGTTKQYIAEATLSNGSVVDVTSDTTWSASSTSVVVTFDIDNPGVAEGVAAGFANIRADFKYDGVNYQDFATINVVPPDIIVGIEVTPEDTTLGLDESVSYSVEVVRTGDRVELDPRECFWTSSDYDVVGIDQNGNAYAKGIAGTAEITAEWDYENQQEYFDTVTVTVSP